MKGVMEAKIAEVAKLGSDALASPFDEAKAIVSDEFCKMSNNFKNIIGVNYYLNSTHKCNPT